jgi:hypothetical protein
VQITHPHHVVVNKELEEKRNVRFVGLRIKGGREGGREGGKERKRKS